MTSADRRRQLELDLRLRRICGVARQLPALTARGGLEERPRLIRALERDEVLKPEWNTRRQRVGREVWRDLAEARALAATTPAGDLYLARLDELELELTLMEVLGEPKQVRPMAARRFGTGDRELELVPGGRTLLRDVARVLLEGVDGAPEPASIPAEGEPSLARFVRIAAEVAGLDISVKVEPRLVANAAAGDRTVYIADRRFGLRQARRLAVHEVLGHLVAAANGRAQRLALLSVGTAGSFADQEGVAIALEEQAGLLDPRRLRTFAARVLVTDRVHAGAPFEETVRRLYREHDFPATEAIALGERAYRGGGVARDAAYLYGWLRVRRAIGDGDVELEELLLGKVGVDDVPALRALLRAGEVRPALHRPRLGKALAAMGHEPEPSAPRPWAHLLAS